ncbi:type IV pilus secretin PilQ [Desulfamplus magnetovallimortis]|uniref:type IV pilus secretin PilQ n=1 Tax=Desulfamplus magnetovallimortis TaxID=1246637 RepID=UPI00164464D6|nr:type IV pilus secretin PilQ [Desulfamplus magnetovallimortis]
MLFVLCFSGCLSPAWQGNSLHSGNSSGQRVLESLSFESHPDSVDVLLKGNAEMKYSSVKQDFPLGVMVYLHSTSLSENLTPPVIPPEAAIASILPSYVDDEKQTAGVNILLKSDLDYRVEEEGDLLRLVFYKKSGQSTVSSQDIDSQSTTLNNIDENPLLQQSGSDKADIGSDTLFAGDASSSQEDRALSNDIFSSDVAEDEHQIAVNAETSSNGAKNLSSAASIEKNTEPLSQEEIFEATDFQATAKLKKIDFQSSADGKTSIVVQTSSPVRYKIKNSRLNQMELQLNLFNTDIPEESQMRLVTTHFDSAVNEMLPVNRLDASEPSRIVFQLRERVPYHVEQQGSMIKLFLEPPLNHGSVANGQPSSISIPYQQPVNPQKASSSAPLKYDSDNLSFSSSMPSVASQPNASSDEVNFAASAGSVEFPENEIEYNYENENMPIEAVPVTADTLYDETPVYTGEKISLDFYETDIKNVFRILRTVSGDNFAIDKDVTGNVTLTLDKPVPWDQILDLVLKMNGLGKVKEGSIIRIATQETLQKEAAQKQARLEARKKELEQQKELEPLVTAYLRVNYADPDTDIKPHLEEIKTERGKISVDKRSRLIIMTDVQNSLDMAKDLIFKLDKVTPQVLISAKVVEASRDFAKEIGVAWGGESQNVYRDDLGGLYGFDAAFNYPAASSSSIGYTFSRLAGTPFLLDARLTASETKGSSKIISSPKIMTLDNKQAKINQGIEVPYDTVSGSGGNSTVTTSFKKIDLMLEVEPSVTPDKRINMKIKITKNDLVGMAADGVPTISTNEAETELLVNNGETIVIGGVVKNSILEGRTAFPFLSDIPYLGHLFRTDSESSVRNELLIFITPTIIELAQKDNLF